MLARPDAVYRELPASQSTLCKGLWWGFAPRVLGVKDGWILIQAGWVRPSDAVPLDQAVSYFSRELSNRESAFSYCNRSNAWLKKREYAKALSDAEAAVMLDPQCAFAYLARARAHEKNKEYQLALNDYDHAIALDRTLIEAYHGRMRVFSSMGEYRRALEVIDEAKAVAPKDDSLELFRDALQTMVEIDESSAGGDVAKVLRFWNNARDFERQGDYENAVEEYKKAAAIDAENSQTHLSWGLTLLAQQRMDEAIEHFKTALALQKRKLDRQPIPPDNKERGSHDRIREFDRSKKGQEAELSKLILSALQTAYMARAALRQSQTLFDRAIQDWTLAIELAPDSADLLCCRARTYILSGKLDEALKDATSANRLDPSCYLSYSLCVTVLDQQGDTEGAFNVVNRGLALLPAHPGLLGHRACILMARGDLGGALADINLAIEAEPRAHSLYLARAEIYAKLSRNGEAARDIEMANKLKTSETASRPE